jgi:hypothetical protein
MQGTEPVTTRKLAANTYAITADPTLGPVELNGCTDQGPQVVSGTPRPRPEPAQSVCDLESSVGTGSPGNMDDLERPPEDLQVLPNPGQADGRTGSWSWYPQSASVLIDDDAGNSALHYSANSLGAWTGATLASLGGNGAGTCYDASAYSGIRFRIKGVVNSTDQLSGQVIVSMVTAETQSQIYGGDLDGEGGHFHNIVAVTPTWQTVSIPFAQLNTPTWGDNLSLTSFASEQLQSIDWGVTNQHTDFDLWFDDIELY